jgi:hypothetical protein
VAGEGSKCAGTTPVNRDSLQFQGECLIKAATHDLAALTHITAVRFTTTASGYLLNGNDLTIGAAGNSSSSNPSIGNQIDPGSRLSTTQFFVGSGAGLPVRSCLNLNVRALKLAWPEVYGTAVATPLAARMKSGCGAPA